MYFIVNRGAEEAYSCYSAVRLLFRDPRFQTICRISGKLPLSPPHFGAFFSTLYFLMRLRDRWACLAFVVLLFGLLPAIVAPQETPWQKENATWREEHKADLLKPDGWLSLVGLEWLRPGDNPVGSAPDNKIILAGAPTRLAILHLEGETVTLNPPAEVFRKTCLWQELPPNRRLFAPKLTRTKLPLVSPSAL